MDGSEIRDPEDDRPGPVREKETAKLPFDQQLSYS
jgi:hypothetical protein